MAAEIGQVWAAKLLQQGTFLWLKMQGMGWLVAEIQGLEAWAIC